MADRRFRVIIYAREGEDVTRLVSRIQREVPEVQVAGVLLESPTPKMAPRLFRHLGLLQPSCWAYALSSLRRGLVAWLGRLGTELLRFLHACPPFPNGRESGGLAHLNALLHQDGGYLLVSADMNSPEAVEFVRGLRPDLGVGHGSQSLKPELSGIPRHGSININMPAVCDSGRLGEGSWRDGEITVAVERVHAPADAGAVIQSVAVPIHPFDNPESLFLKAGLVGSDLVLRSIAGFARGMIDEWPQTTSPGISSELAPRPATAREKPMVPRLVYRAKHWPAWRLVARLLFFGPAAFVRNWHCRRGGRFPVVILYHHLVSDRPHRMGISTDAFLKQIQLLKKVYRFASLQEATEMLRSGKVEAPTLVLTFDDGYRENFINLRAVVEKTGIPVTLLVCTDHISSGKPFEHDVKRNIQGFEPLTWDELRYLARAGFEIGAHTASHFDCGSSDVELLKHEIVTAKAELERHLRLPVKSFSFPWGLPANVSPQALEIARAAYERVLVCWGGANYASQVEFWHLKRSGYCCNLFELDLRIQSILDRPNPWRRLRRTADQLASTWSNASWNTENRRPSSESESQGA